MVVHYTWSGWLNQYPYLGKSVFHHVVRFLSLSANRCSCSLPGRCSKYFGGYCIQFILQPAEHGEVDPAVLAALPPSMQRDLLVQVGVLIYIVMGFVVGHMYCIFLSYDVVIQELALCCFNILFRIVKKSPFHQPISISVLICSLFV